MLLDRPRASLLAFSAAGWLGGAAAGVYDALSATTDAEGAGARLILGAMGANALLGALCGLGCGLLAPALPERLGAAALVRAAGRRLWPGPDDALQDRAFTASTLAAGWLVLLTIFGAFARLAEVALLRVQSAVLLSLFLTVAAVVIWTLAVAVGAPLRAVLARGLERLIRRFPRLATPLHPLAVAAAVVGHAAARLAHWRAAENELWDALDLRAPAALAILFALLLAGGALLSARLPESPPLKRVLGASLGGPLAALALLLWGLSTEASLNALGTATGTTRFVLAVLRLPFDRDADGFASVLGGGDCDDAEPGIHPGAVEVPGNGVDEDCDGADLEKRPGAPGSAPQSGAPAAASEEVHGTHGADGGRPNLVLITIDSLRADHLHAAGYERETSPAIDALAAESVVFTEAHSTSSKTPTSVPSLLTGRYPGELERDAEHFTAYAPGNVFLAELLHEKGYQTSGYPSHWYFQARYGVGQGFETWQPYVEMERRMEKVPCAEPVIVATLKHLENVLTPTAERPFFLWVHLLDPHKSYLDHADAGLPGFGPPGSEAPVDRYDGEIRYVDLWVGKLLDALRARPDWGRTAVILTSDHGEAFGEHGYKYHGFGLHEHQLHVPLLMRLPEVAPRKVEQPVSLIDLVPTVLDLLHIKPDAALGLHGRSLLPAARGQGELASAPLYAETPAGPYNPERAAYFEWPWKLLYDAEGDLYQLFDLGKDPGEKDDRYRSEPEPALRLREALQRFRAETLALRPPTGPVPESGPPTPHGH